MNIVVLNSSLVICCEETSVGRDRTSFSLSSYRRLDNTIVSTRGLHQHTAHLSQEGVLLPLPLLPLTCLPELTGIRSVFQYCSGCLPHTWVMAARLCCTTCIVALTSSIITYYTPAFLECEQ
jgi:hypothetical protein